MLASTWFQDFGLLVLAIALLFVNGFFVAAEFALVKVRPSQLEVMVQQARPFAATAQWLAERLDGALGACQLGITIASLGLGWLGEPAVARLLEPLIHTVGIYSERVLHTISFAIAFSAITAGHLIVGELAPKTFAIRKPEGLARWCAPPLKAFYLLFYPFLWMLNGAALFLVRLFGVPTDEAYGGVHSTEEIRLLLSRAHVEGELTSSEHDMLRAVLQFDDTACRRIMLPRGDVVYLDLQSEPATWTTLVSRTKHTRYPVCEGSLDAVVGIVHIKDFLDTPPLDADALRTLARPPRYVPETMPASRLLRMFQALRQHMALVADEYGTMIGIVTMENVLELIVGRVEDEFDSETPDIVPVGSNQYMIRGHTPVATVSERLHLELRGREAETLAGLVTEEIGRILEVGDRIELDGASAEVVEVKGTRADLIRMTLDHDVEPAQSAEPVERD